MVAEADGVGNGCSPKTRVIAQKNEAQPYEICAGERESAVEVGRWMVTVVP